MIAHYVRLERCPSEQTQTGLASQTPMAYIKGVDADAEAHGRHIMTVVVWLLAGRDRVGYQQEPIGHGHSPGC